MNAKIFRTLLAAALIATTSLVGFAKETASYPTREIENWHDQGMTFVVRDAQGHIVHHAKGQLERWRANHMVWVVRDSEGKFLTRAEGTLERWADGTTRLVLRNKDGKFVAMATEKYTATAGEPLSEAAAAADLDRVE